MEDKLALRARDFWTALVLIAVSQLFLWETSSIPFFKADAAGVDSGAWYNSAALIPYGIFAALLALALVLLVISVRDGGAARALQTVGFTSDRDEWVRLICLAGILTCYIVGLLPRVDFVLSSALVIAALTFGFHVGGNKPMGWALVFIAIPALYAFIMHTGQDEWAKPHDDDWVTFVSFVGLCVFSLASAKRAGHLTLALKLTPVVAVLAPTILVLAMAFGFRQNIPNRTGLIFKQVEYHYYVNILPILRGK